MSEQLLSFFFAPQVNIFSCVAHTQKVLIHGGHKFVRRVTNVRRTASFYPI